MANDHGGRARAAPGRGVAALARDTRGAAAVEFGLIATVLMLLLTGIAQFGAAYSLRGEMLNVAREAARRLAVGDITPAEADAFVAGRMPRREGTVSVDVDAPAGGGDLYTVTLSVPLASVTGIDPFGLFGGGVLSVAVSMRDEVGAT